MSGQPTSSNSPTSCLAPPDVAAAFVNLVAEGGPLAAREGCMLFTEQAGTQFASAHRAPTCVAAMQRLQGQVTDPSTDTSGLTVPATAWTQIGATATLNGCGLSWSACSPTHPSPPLAQRPA